MSKPKPSVSARMWAYRGVSVPLNVFDAREVYPLESSVVLAKVQQLYDIEDRAKPLSVDERLALRQAEAVPI